MPALGDAARVAVSAGMTGMLCIGPMDPTLDGRPRRHRTSRWTGDAARADRPNGAADRGDPGAHGTRTSPLPAGRQTRCC